MLLEISCCRLGSILGFFRKSDSRITNVRLSVRQSVRQSVTKTPKPLRIISLVPIMHRAYQPS